MTRWIRIALAGGALALAVVLFVVLRPGDDDSEPTSATPTTTADTTEEAETTETESETEDATTEEAPTTTEPEGPRRVTVRVRDGRPVGGVERARIEQGEQVLFVVRSDVADHVHLHGYDLLADVAPGQPATIRFRASIPGRFEAELEDRALLIAELEVRP